MTKKMQKILDTLPRKPGVYQMKDVRGKILYVGKAKSLYRRVRSYFLKNSSLEPAKRLMVRKITAIETIVVRNEIEALLLESTLIKKHRPPYNVMLRDDKQFLYLKIDLRDPFPTVESVRRITPKRKEPQVKYFGPYTRAGSVRKTLKLLKRLFGYRTCDPKQGRPCFDYRLGRCLGFCIGQVSEKEYRDVVRTLITFLSGDTSHVLREVEKRMHRAANREQFELAARYRDQLDAICDLATQQQVIAPDRLHADVIGLAREHETVAIALLHVREGKLLRSERFGLENAGDEPDGRLIEIFLERYYPDAAEYPKKLLLPVELPHPATTKRLTGARLTTPHRGRKRSLVKLAQVNAEDHLRKTLLLEATSRDDALAGVAELQKLLNLPSAPRRIETYDISNIQGTSAVGSMVVFEQGLPKRSAYRKFRIKTIPGADDPAMMREILERRLAHLSGSDPSRWPKPQLIVLDGGTTQLGAGVAALHTTKTQIPIIALAKKEESIAIPGKKRPLRMPRHSPALRLLQRGRDEAHRFAITYFRKRHDAASFDSVLDAIPGVGPKRKKQLLRLFGSVQGIRDADTGELRSAVGDTIAKRLRAQL